MIDRICLIEDFLCGFILLHIYIERAVVQGEEGRVRGTGV